MTILEQLLQIDKGKTEELKTKKIKSKRMSELLGKETEITIRQIPGRRMNDINQVIFDENGNKDMEKIYDLNILYCVEGIVEPSVKDSDLMKHFGATTPDDLVEKLFDAEAATIAAEIIKLSGLSDETEKKVKN